MSVETYTCGGSTPSATLSQESIKETYLYPLCTATTPNVISLTVGDLKPAMASCDNNSSWDGCFLMLSTR